MHRPLIILLMISALSSCSLLFDTTRVDEFEEQKELFKPIRIEPEDTSTSSS